MRSWGWLLWWRCEELELVTMVEGEELELVTVVEVLGWVGQLSLH